MTAAFSGRAAHLLRSDLNPEFAHRELPPREVSGCGQSPFAVNGTRLEEGDSTMKRRQFIKRVFGTAAIASTGAFSAGRILGSNDRVNIGVIGCGGRGGLLGEPLRGDPHVDLAPGLDVYAPPG